MKILNETVKKQLLPEGFRDSLPDLAEVEFKIIKNFISIMKKKKFKIVKPPLVEFENSLFFLSKDEIKSDSFRILDPISQKIMGIRSDITSQIARISCGALKDLKRPLKLCYFGQILKVKNSNINISREFTQIGGELIGVTNTECEIDMLKLISEILSLFEFSKFTITLSMPSLVKSISNDFNLNTQQSFFLEKNLENKNLRELKKISDDVFQVSEKLLKSIGSLDKTLLKIKSHHFPSNIQCEINKFILSLENIKKNMPNSNIIIDPIEVDSFGYHNGIMFKFYSSKMRELFSGGRYNINEENCIGFSSLVENLIK